MSRNLCPITRLHEVRPEVCGTVNSAKHHIVERHRNGWAGAGVCAKVAGKWVVDLDALDAWVDARFQAEAETHQRLKAAVAACA